MYNILYTTVGVGDMSTIEFSGIGSTIDDYFLGMYHSDGERLRRAFHPEMAMFGHWRGPLLTQDLDSWIDESVRTPPPSAAGEPFDMRVISIDVTAGMIASVKVVDLYGGVYYTDYLTLAMHEGRWVIVGKLFHYAS